jgi:hypothetical protein
VENSTDAENRLAYEKKALGCLKCLADYIDICDTLDLISEDRAKYWTGLVNNTIKPLKGWLKSEKGRYSEYLKR